jgi:hypothetical protein
METFSLQMRNESASKRATENLVTVAVATLECVECERNAVCLRRRHHPMRESDLTVLQGCVYLKFRTGSADSAYTLSKSTVYVLVLKQNARLHFLWPVGRFPDDVYLYICLFFLKKKLVYMYLHTSKNVLCRFVIVLVREVGWTHSLTHKLTRRMNVRPTLHALTAGTLRGRDGYVCIMYGKARGKKNK